MNKVSLRGLGEVSALGLEAILVSDVDYGVDLAVRTGVGVLSTDRDSLVVSARVVQLTLLFLLDSVACLNTVKDTVA